MIAIDDRCCMVQLGVRVSQFYEHESCGKCTPCRVGTQLADCRSSQKIEDGRARAGRPGPARLASRERINGKCLCPLGDSDAIAVDRATSTSSATSSRRTSTTAAARSTATSSLDDVLAPVAMHTHAHAQVVPA